ncbi:MAG TPA: hypothetical protein VJV78_36690 [Polyangiales bacterium]|nr:hypothetical protein [Polyangiales bacterium]
MRRALNFGVCFLLLSTVACGDDASHDVTKDAGDHDAGNKNTGKKDNSVSTEPMRIPTGGKSGGGAGGTGGTGVGGTFSDDSDYMCKPRKGDVGGAAESGADCCSALGTCAAGGEANSGLPHETCKANPDLRCVPKPREADADAGSGLAGSCRVQFPGSPANAPSYEGRCLPSCFVSASPILGRLSQATCGMGELCSPCYNPLTGRSTGTCERLGDSPLDPPPPGFVECSSGLGYCVPLYAAGNAAGQLSQLTCAAGELCAPKIKVADPNACFEHCDSGSFGPGACVPAFLAGPLSALLSPIGCRTGELCAPCSALGTRTGVCD